MPGKIEKMGYKGVDTTELILADVRIPADRVLGGSTGRGFYQMMDGVEVGRVNVAARGCGVAIRAFELAIDYAQQRHAFGKPIAEHQAIQFKLAEMATKVEAAHQMMVMAARRKDSGHRNDLEAGMAKYLASEYCKEVVEDSFRIHGGYGFSKEYEIERLYREAPMLLIGEGTAEIQKMIMGRRLLEEYRIAENGLPSGGATRQLGTRGRRLAGCRWVLSGRGRRWHRCRRAAGDSRPSPEALPGPPNDRTGPVRAGQGHPFRVHCDQLIAGVQQDRAVAPGGDGHPPAAQAVEHGTGPVPGALDPGGRRPGGASDPGRCQSLPPTGIAPGSHASHQARGAVQCGSSQLQCQTSTSGGRPRMGRVQLTCPPMGWFSDSSPPCRWVCSSQESAGRRKSIQPVSPSAPAWPPAVVTSWPGSRVMPYRAAAAGSSRWWLTVL